MIILAIETSCDETAISVVEPRLLPSKNSREGGQAVFKVLAHVVASQIKLHAKWGGVVPNLARREHQKNLVPVLKKALKSTRGETSVTTDVSPRIQLLESKIKKILERETELIAPFLEFINNNGVPKIDAIAVTRGPGLEPALWVGINFAKALALAWNKPLIPINHMEGHIYSVLIPNEANEATHLSFPALALLVSGGHTELVIIKNWLKHKIICQTLDDAVGEAFDKVARLLDLPYPGGPEISRLAKIYVPRGDTTGVTEVSPRVQFPRPMLHSPDFNFSFSGLKTAVLYTVNKLKASNADGKLSDQQKMMLAYEFEQAAVETLVKKTAKAITKFKPKTLIIAGGVAANQELGKQMQELIKNKFSPTSLKLRGASNLQLLISNLQLSTDNATMIAVTAYLHLQTKTKFPKNFKADGGLSLDLLK